MNEDAQPNEKPLNRKGASVPVIRSTRTTGRSKGTLQSGGYPGTRCYQKPFNRPHAGSYSYRSSPTNSQYTCPSKRLKSIYDGPYSTRRQFDHESSSSSHSQYGTSNIFSTSRSSAQKRKSTGRSEPLESSVVSQCKKGLPYSQRPRSDWRTRHARNLNRANPESEPSLQCSGTINDCARSAVDDKCKKHSENHSLLVNLPLASISTGPDVFSMPGIVPNNIPDEIIIAENIDTLESNFQDLFPPFSQTQLSNLPSRLESSLTMTPESFEPPRVFKSGVLSLFSAEDPSLPSSVAPSLRPSASLVPSIVETPEFSQHTDATTSLSVEREGSLFSSFHERSASCLSDSSIKISRRPSDHNTSAIETFGNSTSPCAIVPEDVSAFLPLAQHDKVRRFILFNSRSLASVSMRGSVDLIDAGSLRHQHSLNTQRPNELIDDACIVQTGDDSLVILGHARDHEQLSWCRSRCGTDKGEILFLLRPWNKNKKGGVSAVTSMMQPMQFATGGYDHTVHLWDVKSDLSGASPRTLAIKHTSHVQSLLAIRDTSHKLVSAGADCNVHIWDLSSERVVNTLRVSNIIYHLHTMTSPFCTLLEVAHRELQFEVRDHRLVPEHPVIRFGYTTDKVHGRYTKGAVSTQFFASGSKDGYVRLWDLRNAGSAATTAAICHGQKIIQVLFKEANLIICTETGQTSLFKYEY